MAESSIDMDKVREFIKEKSRKRRARLEDRLERARLDFERMVSIILEKYNPKRIYQWGSLLSPERFSEISDIDIAVEGIKSYEDFSRMYEELEPLSSLPLDVVQLENIHPLHAETIRTKGKLIYERKD